MNGSCEAFNVFLIIGLISFSLNNIISAFGKEKLSYVFTSEAFSVLVSLKLNADPACHFIICQNVMLKMGKGKWKKKTHFMESWT